jgi:hypothetical protein
VRYAFVFRYHYEPAEAAMSRSFLVWLDGNFWVVGVFLIGIVISVALWLHHYIHQDDEYEENLRRRADEQIQGLKDMADRMSRHGK